jgi:hypothetical protein
MFLLSQYIGYFFLNTTCPDLHRDRHIGHIDLYKVLIVKDLYINLCVLCAYVLKKF